MDCTLLERLTINALPNALPCQVAYVLPEKPFGEGFLFWNMDYLLAVEQQQQATVGKEFG